MEFTVQSRNPHIAVFPLSAGMGHFRPTVEFAKRLCVAHGFSVTLIISKWLWTSQQDAFTQALASSGLDIRFTEIPDISLDEDEEDMKIETRISKFALKAKPHVEDVLQSLLKSSSPVSAFVTDFFCTALLDVTSLLTLPTYLIVPSSASCVCVMMHLPKLVSEIEISFKDADFDVEIPGLPLIPARNLPTPVQDRSDSAFHWFIHHGSRFKEATGIFVNTFAELEEEPLKALAEGKIVRAAAMPYIYPIGPLMVENTDRAIEPTECLKCIDEQPPSSVVFVSFGSGSVLSGPQIADLAFGLEASGHRFLWVLRGYKPGSSSLETEVSRLLPEGFENRTRDRGLVVFNWAPQVGVLSHPSTGGFIAHCGWNSTLESICHGVPMIGWPVAAEQRMNRVILVKQIKAAVDLKMESDGFVRREEVRRAVKELMEGEEGRMAREKMKELKDKARIAMMEGGSSVEATATAAAHLSSHTS